MITKNYLLEINNNNNNNIWNYVTIILYIYDILYILYSIRNDIYIYIYNVNI